VNVGDRLVVGDASTARGYYLQEGGTLTARSLMVGMSGTGTFEQIGGASTVGDLYLASPPAAPAPTSCRAALWLTTTNTLVGLVSTGEIKQSGGSHTAAQLIVGTVAGTNFIGKYSLSGGNLSAPIQSINNGSSVRAVAAIPSPI